MGAAGASFRVAKNRLAVRALKGTPVEGIAHLFKGPTGIAAAMIRSPLRRWWWPMPRTNDKLVILGGAIGGAQRRFGDQ